MKKDHMEEYDHIRGDVGAAYYEQNRGLIAVWGKEAVPFLDGMITNDMKTLGDGEQMLAAFPNAQGRLLAVVRVQRDDDRFYFETEEATRETVFNNLFRFTFAGDFFVEDISGQYDYFELFGSEPSNTYHGGVASFRGIRGGSVLSALPLEVVDNFRGYLASSKVLQISDDVYETLRIESGIPLYGVDMDETTIVPELGLDGLISYNKGCYIGQEIIARIHFRGHVAKRLTGLVSEPGAIATGFLPGAELTTEDGKNAGRITSVAFSAKLDTMIALAFVRYDYLAAGTELNVAGKTATVTDLPFIN